MDAKMFKSARCRCLRGVSQKAILVVEETITVKRCGIHYAAFADEIAPCCGKWHNVNF